MTTIALIGKPNVGKSSLFNRLAKERDAIISEIAGTTRDVKKREIEIDGKKALLVDTGGLEERDSMFKVVRQHAIKAAKEADIVLFMVDGKMLPDEDDKRLFFELQDISKSIALVINKIDNENREEAVYEYMSFGANKLFDISVSHNRKVSSLINWISNQLEDEENIDSIIEEDDFLDILNNYDESGKLLENSDDNELKVAILGRPNVGKSSLLNSLVGEERSVVSEIAGTTIDPVDETIEYNKKKITFVDTAGIRKRSKIEGIEKFALMRNKKMLENADIALLVLDCSEDFMELDERIGGMIDEFRLGCIIVLNKYDIKNRDHQELIDDVRYRFKYLSYAPIVTISAQSKKRVHKINDIILKVYDRFCSRISTSDFNRTLELALQRHQIPSDRGKIVRIYYGTQFETKPPRFALISNRPSSVHFSYLRYIENKLREVYDFEGTPIVIKLKNKNMQKEDEKID